MGEKVSLQEAFDQGFEAVKGYVDRVFAKFEKRIEALEAQGIKYCGVWERSVHYRKGSVVTDHGAAWVALKDVGDVRPGGNDSWQLMVRAGRDGKEPR